MKNVELKRVLLGGLTAIVLCIMADWAVGTWSEKMYYKSQYGAYHRQLYCMIESNDELLIMGSSRAAHHYVPSVFEDSLGVSCYNAGTDGMCIYYHYAILSAMIQRGASPKLVLLEVMPSDVEITAGATFTLDAALDYLSPHYGEYPQIDSLFSLNGWEEHLKLLSKTYQYKSKLVQLIKCNYIPFPEDKGYEALIGTKIMDSDLEAFDQEISRWDDADNLKVHFFNRFIKLCNDNQINLVLAYSPYYHVQPSGAIDHIKQIAIDSNIPFIDYSLNEDFQKAELFYDGCHLNDTGARLYSAEIVNVLRDFGL